MTSFEFSLYIISLMAVFAFAITGALSAAKREMDLISFIVVGSVTAMGGGTIRDILLNADVFWLHETEYLHTAILASVLTYFFARQLASLDKVLIWIDAVGMALFTVLGTVKAQSLGAPPLVALILGVMVPTFGSVIRDVMLQHRLVFFDPEIYVTACILGNGTYLVLDAWGVDQVVTLLSSVGVAFIIRGLAIHYDLRLPKYKMSQVQVADEHELKQKLSKRRSLVRRLRKNLKAKYSVD